MAVSPPASPSKPSGETRSEGAWVSLPDADSSWLCAALASDDTCQRAVKPLWSSVFAFGRNRPPNSGCRHDERIAMSLLSAMGAMPRVCVPASAISRCTLLAGKAPPGASSSAWTPSIREAIAPVPAASVRGTPSTSSEGVPTSPRTSAMPTTT